MSKVYAVVSGEYSDYQVHAIFSTKELGQEYINHRIVYGDERGYVFEEYELDMAKPFPECYKVCIDSKGEVQWWVWHCAEPDEAYSNLQKTYYYGEGKTVEHARRSAEELRRQTLVLEGFAKTEHDGYNVFNPVVEE